MLRRIAILSLFALAHCSSAEPTPSPSGEDADSDQTSDTDSPGKTDARVPSRPDAAAPRDARAPTPPSEGPAPVVDASQGPAADAGGTEPGGEPVGKGAFPAVTDVAKAGPYKTKSYGNGGPGGNYTIHQPDPLGPEGLKHPILTWGNGGSTTPGFYGMLPHLASHGFVVVAANTVPSIGAEVALGKDMTAGMDWMIEQNAKPDSEYFGKLDTVNVAPFGYSMGGLATFTIVGDPRWITTVHLSGGNMGEGPARLAKAHAPMFWECGENDIADGNCKTDFTNLTTQSVMYGMLKGADHLGILGGPAETNIRGAVTGWFRYYLMKDQDWKKMFVGADCTLCKDTATWEIKKKNYE